MTLTLHPHGRVLGHLLLLIAVLLVRPEQLGLLAALSGLVAGLLALAGTPPGPFLRGLGRALPFVLLLTVPALLLRWLGGGESLADAGRYGAGVLAKAGLSIALVLGLTARLSFSELRAGLAGVGVPPLLTDTMALAWRYLGVLNAERIALVRSLAARGHTAGWIWQSRMPGYLVGSLFLRSVERAERVQRAMVAREPGRAPAGEAPHRRWSAGDIAFAAATGLACAALLLGVR